MRKIGGHVSTSGGIINAVENTLNIGGNCMQIFAGSPRMWKRSLYEEAEASNFKATVLDNSLNPVFIHALYLTNLASDKADLRAKSREALIYDMKNSSLIGSSGVVLHIGSHQGRGFDEVKDLVVEEINSVLAATPEDSILLLENSAGQKGKIGTIEELGHLIKELNSPRIGVCLDTAHAFEAGNAIHTQQGLEIFVNKIKKHIPADVIKLLHLNDSRTKFASTHDQHENIGEGFIGKSAIQRIINHPLFSELPIILEVPGFDKSGPDKKNIDTVRSLT